MTELVISFNESISYHIKLMRNSSRYYLISLVLYWLLWVFWICLFFSLLKGEKLANIQYHLANRLNTLVKSFLISPLRTFQFQWCIQSFACCNMAVDTKQIMNGLKNSVWICFSKIFTNFQEHLFYLYH